LAEESVEELLPIPRDLTGAGDLFMLKVRGESMIDVGIFDGDFVVVRRQEDAESGDIVVAAIGDDEATVKTLRKRRGKIVLVPANAAYSEIEVTADRLVIYGKVVTVLRRL